MNLEHHRKAAKRLARSVKQGAPEAIARAAAVLGERARERFQLSDAQHVIARELGYRTWSDLRHASAPTEGGSGEPPRVEALVDTGLEYRPGDSVLIRVVRREGSTRVSDDGAAFERAGSPSGWPDTARKVTLELEVNFGRDGSISLPVVAAGPPEGEVVMRIGAASLAFYQELLDLT